MVLIIQRRSGPASCGEKSKTSLGVRTVPAGMQGTPQARAQGSSRQIKEFSEDFSYTPSAAEIAALRGCVKEHAIRSATAIEFASSKEPSFFMAPSSVSTAVVFGLAKI